MGEYAQSLKESMVQKLSGPKGCAGNALSDAERALVIVVASSPMFRNLAPS
jgi:hypothetical protein